MINEYLLDIVLFVNNVVGIFVAVRFLNQLLTKKNINKVITKSGLTMILIISTLINISFEEFIVNLLIGVLLYYSIGELFYEGKKHIKLVAAIFFIVFSMITELLTATVFGIVFGASIQGVRDNVMHLFLGGVVSKILLILLVEIVIKFRSRNASVVSLTSWLLIISIPVISIALAILVVYEPIVNNSFSNSAVYACLAIIYIDLIAFYLFDSIVIQIEENNIIRLREKQLLLQQYQYENIISGHKQVKKIRHDMLSHLITIDGYLEVNKVDEAKNYIGKLNSELDFERQGILSGNVGVDAIINNRMATANEYGIKTSIEVMIPNKFKLDDLDLSVIVGNVLTNAVEACQRIDDGASKYIQFTMKYKRDSILIEVRNSYNEKTIKEKNGRFISSKVSRSNNEIGLGLSNVEAVVKKYDGIFERDMKENEFVIKVIIPDKKIA